VTVMNASSLPACLSMGPGASVCARPEDGVVMVAVAEEKEGLTSTTARTASYSGQGGGAGGSAVAPAGVSHALSGRGVTSVSATEGKSFEMVVHAVGAEVHLVDAGDAPASFSGGRGGGRGGGGEAAAPHVRGVVKSESGGSLQGGALAAAREEAVRGAGSSSSSGGRRYREAKDGGAASRSSARLLRRLVLLLDATTKLRMSIEVRRNEEGV
jgi:vacuolar protein sorting-associated protein 13A/C